jgi:hypothetical protein
MNREYLYFFTLLSFLLLVNSCKKEDQPDLTSPGRLSSSTDYLNNSSTERNTYDYEDSMLIRVTGYKADGDGNWIGYDETELSYPTTYGVELSYRNFDRPHDWYYSSRAISDDKLLQIYSPEHPYPFSPAHKTVYQYDGELLSQIVSLQSYKGWDTLLYSRNTYTDDLLIGEIRYYFDNYERIPHFKTEYSYKGSEIEEVLIYEFHKDDSAWILSEKAVNEYHNSLLNEVDYYAWEDSSWVHVRKEQLEYDDWGNLVLWERHSFISGNVRKTEFEYEDGEGNHGIVFNRAIQYNWKCWYPYPVLY